MGEIRQKKDLPIVLLVVCKSLHENRRAEGRTFVTAVNAVAFPRAQ